MDENREVFLAFATALAYILQPDQGIVVQLKDPEFSGFKYLVYRDSATQSLQVNRIEPEHEELYIKCKREGIKFYWTVKREKDNVVYEQK